MRYTILVLLWVALTVSAETIIQPAGEYAMVRPPVQLVNRWPEDAPTKTPRSAYWRMYVPDAVVTETLTAVVLDIWAVGANTRGGVNCTSRFFVYDPIEYRNAPFIGTVYTMSVLRGEGERASARIVAPVAWERKSDGYDHPYIVVWWDTLADNRRSEVLSEHGCNYAWNIRIVGIYQ